MSGHRRHPSRREPSPDPVVIERRPQERTYQVVRPRSPARERPTIGESISRLLRGPRRGVRIVENTPVRRRHPERVVRAPSPFPYASSSPSSSSTPTPTPSAPSPPSPSTTRPRHAYYTMAADIHAPLPPELPPRRRQHRGDADDDDHDVEERAPRWARRAQVHADPDDVDAHPHVERATSPRRRDSGYHYVDRRGDDESSDGRPPDRDCQILLDHLAREKRGRHDAERDAAWAHDQAERLSADLAREMRQRSIERRERLLAEWQARLNHERAELARQRRPPAVVHNGPPTVVPAAAALDRARADFDRTHGAGERSREERRPGTGDRRSRVVVVDENDRRRGRDRYGRR